MKIHCADSIAITLSGKSRARRTVYYAIAGLLLALANSFLSLAHADARTLVVSPQAIDFGNIVFGASKQGVTTLLNTGSENIEVTGLATSNAVFTVVSPSAPFTLAAGASRAITVAFTPTAVAIWNAGLVIDSNATNQPRLIVALRGQGNAIVGCGVPATPTVDIRVETMALNFGEVDIGSIEQRVTTVINTGTADLEISGLTMANGDFYVVSPATPLTLVPGASQAVTVAFHPGAAGTVSGNLLIDSNDADEARVTVSLSGQGNDVLSAGAPLGTAFYEAPQELLGNNGKVYWATEIAPANNGRIWKILYRSQDLHGTPIAVSGWLAIPSTVKPAGGFPILAFAHGTTGLADFCAPTQRSTPKDTIALLEEFLARGFVVSASDYQGLGTAGTHHYLVGPSEAHSILDSARAARAIGGGSADVFLFGHSQGGHAVLFANELAAQYAPEHNILGTIGSATAVSGTSGSVVEALKSSDYKGYLIMAAVAQYAAYGDESPLSRWLTPYGIQAAQTLDSICVDQLSATYAPLAGSAVFVAGAPLAATTGQYDIDSDTTPGLRVGASPLLMIHGRYDSQIPASLIPSWAENTCDLGQSIQLNWFNTGHRVPYEAPQSAAAVIFDWIDDRLAGQVPASDCGAMPQP